jgi:autotransporter-associated beta strand protein
MPGTLTSGGNGFGTGGAIFVRDGASLTIAGGSFSNDTVTGGNPTYPNLGQAMFLGSNVTFNVISGAMTIAETLGGNGGVFGYSYPQTSADTDGGIIKTGAGTLVLTAANNYSGGTLINAGTLLVNNTSGSGTGSANSVGIGGTVTVNKLGTLGGNGAIAGNVVVNNGGTVAPGASPGILTINNNVLFHNGSNFAVDLLGTTVGNGYDRLVVNGTVDLDSPSLQLNVGAQFNGGDKFFILANDGTDAINGTFAGLPQDATISIGDQTFGISYTGDVDTGSLTGGNDIVLFTVGVPEPSTLALGALAGLVAIGSWRWRRCRR